MVTNVLVRALAADAAAAGARADAHVSPTASKNHRGCFTPNTVAVRAARDNPICEVRPNCRSVRNGSGVVGSFRRIVRVDGPGDAVARGTGVLVSFIRLQVGGRERLGHLVRVAHAPWYPVAGAVDVSESRASRGTGTPPPGRCGVVASGRSTATVVPTPCSLSMETVPCWRVT